MQVGLMLGFERGPRRASKSFASCDCGVSAPFVACPAAPGVDDLDEVPESCPLPGVGVGRSPSALLFWFSVITVTLIRRPANG